MNKVRLVESRLDAFFKLLSPCRLCPRQCLAQRTKGQTGFCNSTNHIRVAAWASHRGEEPAISGSQGSGTIFSSNCTLGCCFCQNFPFSQLGNGNLMDSQSLADVFSKLARDGVHNLNFVTPGHVMPMLLQAWLLASPDAQKLPIVYNCSGYESLELLELLADIVDIYIPDSKYADDNVASKLSKCVDYVKNNRQTLLNMHKQVGNLTFDEHGIARKGMIIRHLVLPNGLAGSKEVFKWIKKNIGDEVFLSLMSQYFPAHKAMQIPEINRGINDTEYLEVLELVELLGFKNVWAQDPSETGGA